MEIEIRAIRNEEAVYFLKQNNSRNEVVFDTDSDFWLGAFFEGELIGVNGICYKKNHFKNKSLFVKKTFRKNGCAKLLSKKIIELFGECCFLRIKVMMITIHVILKLIRNENSLIKIKDLFLNEI